MRPRLLWIPALSIVVACHQEPPRPHPAVRVETVARASAAAVERYSGTLLAQTQVDVSFRGSGYVKSIATVPGANDHPRPLQAGDHVREGALLASLRESDFKAKLDELGGMSADANAAYQRAKADYVRAKTLLKEGSISRVEFDSAQARYSSAAGSEVAASARVTSAKIALSDAHLRAPFDGIVLARNLEPGALVAPGSVAFVIADTTTMRVAFGVSDGVQRTLALEQLVTLTTDAIPLRTFAGTVTKIAAQADPRTRVFEVEASVDNADFALKVGMIVDVRLEGREKGPPAVLVPLSAIVRPPGGNDGFAAYVVASHGLEERAHIRTLALGDLVANRVAVTAGLSAGDRIVVQGATLVHNDEQVVVVP